MRKIVSDSRLNQAGFSLIELFVVVALIFILSSISLFLLTGHQTLYKPDDQTLLITDMLQEARQRALTQRETMRVEINRDTNTVRLIDENTNVNIPPPDTVGNDQVIRQISLFESSVVTVGVNPANIAYNPPEPSTLPVPTAVFVPSVYPSSISQSVCTLRFLANGTVTNAGNNALGAGAVTTGVTIHVWAPQEGTPTQSSIARSITVIGATGTVRAWEFDPSSVAANKWKDSRRTGSY